MQISYRYIEVQGLYRVIQISVLVLLVHVQCTCRNSYMLAVHVPLATGTARLGPKNWDPNWDPSWDPKLDTDPGHVSTYM